MALEFVGDGAAALEHRRAAGRLEHGGRGGCRYRASSRPTSVTAAYLDGRTDRPWTAERTDDDAEVAARVRIDLAGRRAARRAAALARQRRPRERRGRPQDRPGLHRQLRERDDDRPAPGGRDPARPERAPGLPRDHRPGVAEDLPAGARGGPARRVRRGGLHRDDADLRRLPRRPQRHHRRQARARSRPRTGTSRAGWGRTRRSCTSPTRGSRRRRRSPARSSIRPTSSGGLRPDRRGAGSRDRPGRRRHRRHVPGSVHRDPRRQRDGEASLRRPRSDACATSWSATRSSSPAPTSAPARRGRTCRRRCARPGSAASSRRASRGSSTATASTSACPRSAARRRSTRRAPARRSASRSRPAPIDVDGQVFRATALPPFMVELLNAGGLAPWIRSGRGAEEPVSAGRLDGKTAVITGASGGIGRVACRLFCEEGAVVVGTDRRGGARPAARGGAPRRRARLRVRPLRPDLVGGRRGARGRGRVALRRPRRALQQCRRHPRQAARRDDGRGVGPRPRTSTCAARS